MIFLDFNKEMVRTSGIAAKDFSPLLQKGIRILEREKKLFPLKKFLAQHRKAFIQFSLVDDVMIRKYNAEYRGLDKATDVLSFSYYQYYTSPEMSRDGLLGEILISVETARKQAKEHKKTLKQELQFLFVHGLLHLFEYDHEEEEERREMFDLQDEILGTRMWRELVEEMSK